MNHSKLKLFVRIGYILLFVYLAYVALILMNEDFLFLHFSIVSAALMLISFILMFVSIVEKRKLLIIASAIFSSLFILDFILRIIYSSYEHILINYTFDAIYYAIFAIAVCLFSLGILDFIAYMQKRKNIHNLAFENSSAIYVEYDKSTKNFIFQFSKSFSKLHHITTLTRNYTFEEIKAFTKEADKNIVAQVFQNNNFDEVIKLNMKLPDLQRYLSFYFYAPNQNDHLMWIAFDVTDMDTMKKQLALSKNQLKELSLANKEVIENTNELIVIFDINGNVMQASNRYCEIFDLDPKKISGLYVNEIGTKLHQVKNDWFEEAIHEKISISISEYEKNGQRFFVSWKNVLLTDGYGQPKSIISVGEDITQITNLTKSLEYQADYNQITELLNTNGLNKKIKEIKEVRSAACFLIDIDEFYTILDYYGVEIAKKLLKLIASELSALLSKHDLLANNSEDHFILLLVNPSKVLIEKTKELLEEQIVKTYIEGDLHIQVKKRIGYAVYNEDTKDFNDLINYARLASYHKPDTQYNQVTKYQPIMKSNLEKNIILGNRLVDAIKHEKIDIHMQYIMDASTRKAIYVEALARWNDEVLGFISPDEFFKVARKSNLLEMLELHLLQKSFSSFKKLKEKEGHEEIKLTINLSPEIFLKEGFVNQFHQIAINNQVNPDDVFVEVSENTFVHNKTHCNEMIKKFKKSGYYIAIDDFGSEYSSLAVLENIEYDMIKIDGSFINHLESKKNHAIVEMISRIGSLSHKIIVAEMVETRDESEILLKTNIYLQQGYYFHKPQKLI